MAALMGEGIVGYGQELTYDYGWPAEIAIANRCRCGSVKCRRYIVEEGREYERLLKMLKRRQILKAKTSHNGKVKRKKRSATH